MRFGSKPDKVEAMEATEETAAKQAVFDRVWAGAERQAWCRAVSMGGTQCRYWEPSTQSSCAIGLLLPADLVKSGDLEGVNIKQILLWSDSTRVWRNTEAVLEAQTALRALGVSSSFLLDLQRAHDLPTGFWADRMRGVAVRHGLEAPPEVAAGFTLSSAET